VSVIYHKNLSENINPNFQPLQKFLLSLYLKYLYTWKEWFCWRI